MLLRCAAGLLLTASLSLAAQGTQPPLNTRPQPGQPGNPANPGDLSDPTVAAAAPPTFVPNTSSPPPAPARPNGPIRISGGVMAGQIVTRVNPVYPLQAKSAGVEGSVVLQALISKEGAVEDLSVISGPPALADAAVTAVRQWTYKPYFLNGEPIKVRTTITVNFKLDPPAPAMPR